MFFPEVTPRSSGPPDALVCPVWDYVDRSLRHGPDEGLGVLVWDVVCSDVLVSKLELYSLTRSKLVRHDVMDSQQHFLSIKDLAGDLLPTPVTEYPNDICVFWFCNADVWVVSIEFRNEPVTNPVFVRR